MFNVKGPQGQNPRTTCGPRTTVWETLHYTNVSTDPLRTCRGSLGIRRAHFGNCWYRPRPLLENTWFHSWFRRPSFCRFRAPSLFTGRTTPLKNVLYLRSVLPVDLRSELFL